MGRSLLIGDKVFDLGKRTLIMGILNVTPDSFYDGGKYMNSDIALKHAHDMVKNGADIIDVGGESTRPGSRRIPAKEELSRVIPIIKKLRKEINVPISIDTYKSEVARAALDSGADIVNDISGLKFDESISEVAGEFNCALVLSHIRGTPEDMQKNISYNNLISEIKDSLRNSIIKAESSGVNRNKIIIDPGIGFGKGVRGNLLILKKLTEFKDLGKPLMIGTSRKSFIGSLLSAEKGERLEGTLATVCAAVLNGADIVRVHDVKEISMAVKIIDAIRNI
ncbi:MAG: dihydropteroate synthase [Candidatus Schekmanbacteria bacterium RIFCSPHIGHO2_02_FULL_38_11]|nr:MAG: dihydropteroate synthase [Candidatus Schekmanbacteria bacterium RIFCSPHIGHO2_02_FULL_38_11]